MCNGSINTGYLWSGYVNPLRIMRKSLLYRSTLHAMFHRKYHIMEIPFLQEKTSDKMRRQTNKDTAGVAVPSQ